ncbi:MAG: DUF5691 domain-containing protein [Propionibacteriaceae bacterium]|nr:DUF5691 domain-containing protein [Propionibacteriaceae bacterium]
MSQDLAELVASATVGLGARPVNTALLPEPLRPEPGESAFLDAAALATLASRSQRGIASDPWALPDPPQLGTGRMVTATQHGLLRQLLAAPAEVVAACLQLLVDHDAETPIRWLPELAVQGLAPASPSRQLVAQAAGDRGRWLLGENPAWRPLLRHWRPPGSPGPDADGAQRAETGPPATDQTPATRQTPVAEQTPATDHWSHGSLPQRVAWLRALRAADPGLAREELAQVWAKSRVAERAELVKALEVGLSAADSSLLAKARADRSDKVSRPALRLSSRLAEGEFAERRAELIRAHFTVSKSLFARKLTVSALEADPGQGIAEGPAPGLASFVEFTPLPLWRQVLGLDPIELGRLKPAGVDYWDPAPAFLRAAFAQGDSVLLNRLLDQVADPLSHIDDPTPIDYPNRLAAIRRELAQNDEWELWRVQLWLGDVLPREILDDAVAAFQESPNRLGSPSAVLALARCDLDQVARLRALIPQMPEDSRSAGSRAVGHLTLLSRLNQELS